MISNQGFSKTLILVAGAFLALSQTACSSRATTMPVAATTPVPQSPQPTATPVSTVFIPDSHLADLIRIELDMNSTDPITPAAMAAVTELNIWEEGISNLTGLQDCLNLQYLDLESNAVTSLARWVFV